MPGKVNPVLPVSMIQIGYAVVGDDVCIAQANQGGQLEINHFEPVVAARLFDSIRLLRNGLRRFREGCIDGLRAHTAVNEDHLMQSTAIATALVPRLGYARVSGIVRECAAAGKSLLQALAEQGLLEAREARLIVEAAAPVAPADVAR